METVFVLIKQVIIMFVLMSVGYICYKKKLISDQGSKDIGNILLYVAIPVVIVSNFHVERTAEKTQAFFYSILFSFLAMLAAMIISYLIYHKKDGVSEFSATFSNSGFVGIPLIQAVVGSHAIFYISMMIVLTGVLQWTYGVFAISGDKSAMKPKKVLSNPVVIAVFIGSIIFFGNITLPSMVSNVFSIISGLNTPLAMIVSGVYLAQSDLLGMLRKKKVYEVSLIRLILIPLVTIVIFRMIPYENVDMLLAILLAAACPVGSNVAIYAQQYDKDYTSAVENVCISTILSIITLPLVVMIASFLFR
ncbi:MAG: AEC family transporter [Erysipelotrichaceae bacterium]|nr:AEC family transporter [Erysipelotrichaceae bacterium]